jgi:predicted lactoylglutathione lyase
MLSSSPALNANLVIRKIAFAIDADKFPEAIAELKGNGADLRATEDTGIAYSVFFHDPDGHLLEITTFSYDQWILPTCRRLPQQ